MSETSFDIPCEWESRYEGSSLAGEIAKIQYLTGLRNFTVNDVLRYTQLMHKDGIPFYLTREDFHDCFNWIRQQLGYDSDSANFPNAVSVLNLLFNVFDKDEDNTITRFEFAVGLAVMCGGKIKDNIRSAFEMVRRTPRGTSPKNRKRKSRTIGTKHAYDAYCTMFRLLYQLFDDILSRVGCDPDTFARSLTLRAFHRHNKHHRKHHHRHRHHQKHGKYKHTKERKKFRSHIKVSTFVHWYHIGVDHIICENPMLVEDHYQGGGLHVDADVTHDSGGHHHSMISMQDAIRILGLHSFTPNMIIQYVTDLCDEDGTLSETTLHQGLIKLIRRNYVSLPLMDRPLADHILQRLYLVFKVKGTDMCTFTDIISGLLVFSGGSITAKAKAVFSLFSQKAASPRSGSMEAGITHEGICSCLTVIFKVVSDLDPGHHFASVANCEEIARQLSNDIFVQNPQYRFSDHGSARGLLPLNAFIIVFSQIMMKFDANIGNKRNRLGLDLGDAGSEPSGDREAFSDDDDDCSAHSDSSEEYMAQLTRQRSQESRDSASMDGGFVGGEDDYGSIGSVNNISSNGSVSSAADSEADSDGDSDGGSRGVDSNAAVVGGRGGGSAHAHHEHVYAAAHANVLGSPPAADETEHVLLELQQARHILQLNGITCHDLLDVLSEFSTASGTSLSNQLSLPSWLMIVQYFCKLNSASNKEIANATVLAQRIFAAVSVCSEKIGAPTEASQGKPSSNFLPYVHMAIGVALALCENQTTTDRTKVKNIYEDKLQMAFTLMDEDNDNKLTLFELNQLVMCTLVVMQVCSPTAANKITRSECDLHELGAILLSIIFDPNSDPYGLVSFEQMQVFVRRALVGLDM